jgi:hypothetical protein
MTDPWGEPARPATSARCPWCSAELRNDPARCPSCGAQLHEEAAAEIPGVTQLDPAATVGARPAPRSRSLLGWLSGEYEPGESAAERGSVSPPSAAVRAEMARLEMAAIQAELAAAAEAPAVDDAPPPAVPDQSGPTSGSESPPPA